MSDPENVYEQPQILSDYLLFHYGSGAQILPGDFSAAMEGVKGALHFPLRCVAHLVDGDSLDPDTATAYDLGCAVGRSTFELARHARKVTGYDLSEQFIDAAKQLLDGGEIASDILIEGAITEPAVFQAPALPDGTDIAFEVGDAVELAETLPPADLVFAANLLCRLPMPARFLQALPRLVKPGGQLLLVTPFTWLSAFTPEDAWPIDAEARPMAGRPWIARLLGQAFTLEHSEDLPFLIREHRRKYQFTIAHGMRWRRRN
ncbi:MAG: methyltransferase domain-containing protein [Alphaproteobacteria bacterium]